MKEQVNLGLIRMVLYYYSINIEKTYDGFVFCEKLHHFLPMTTIFLLFDDLETEKLLSYSRSNFPCY
jgi:hypothetical protein